MIYTLVSRVILPRCKDGADWGTQRWLLARYHERVLWWWPSHKSWQGRLIGYAHEPASLCVQTEEMVSYMSLSEGGRLSMKLLRTHAAIIEERFGCALIEHLSIDKTLLIEDN